jgi:hypothetical protein
MGDNLKVVWSEFSILSLAVSFQSNVTALLELKTQSVFCPVTLSLSSPSYKALPFNCMACIQPLQELKTWPRFCPVSLSLSSPSYKALPFNCMPCTQPLQEL